MAAGLEDEPGSFGHIFESALAAIEKAGVRTAQRTDDQIKSAVAIDVGKHRATRSLIGAIHTRARSDIFKLAISEVAVERVGTFEIAEIKVAKTVSIEIPGCDARPVEKVLVRLGVRVGKGVGETDVRLVGTQ